MGARPGETQNHDDKYDSHNRNQELRNLSMWRRVNQPAPQSQPIRLTSGDDAVDENAPDIVEFGKVKHLRYPLALLNQLEVVNPKNGARLKENAQVKFDEMLKAAASYKAIYDESGRLVQGDPRAPQGIHLFARYGFRDLETQERAWNHAEGNSPSMKARSAAPPHYSEHHTGLAVDINWRDGAITEGSPAHNWLIANAGKYGFVNSFPRGNAQGIKPEPWHWRFQGDCDSREVFKQARERFGPPETEEEREAWSHCDAE